MRVEPLKFAAAAIVIATASSWALPFVNQRAPTLDDRLVAPARFVTDEVSLRDQLASARVTWGDDVGRGFTGQRWVSSKEPWLWVGPYRGLLTVGGRGAREDGPSWRPCIWAHAAGPDTGPKARPLTIRFENLAPFGRLHGEVGLVDAGRDGGLVDFTVTVQGARPVRVPVSDTRGEKRWIAWEAPTPGSSVEFKITASSPDWRQLCFTAFAGAAR